MEEAAGFGSRAEVPGARAEGAQAPPGERPAAPGEQPPGKERHRARGSCLRLPPGTAGSPHKLCRGRRPPPKAREAGPVSPPASAGRGEGGPGDKTGGRERGGNGTRSPPGAGGWRGGGSVRRGPAGGSEGSRSGQRAASSGGVQQVPGALPARASEPRGRPMGTHLPAPCRPAPGAGGERGRAGPGSPRELGVPLRRAGGGGHVPRRQPVTPLVHWDHVRTRRET